MYRTMRRSLIVALISFAITGCSRVPEDELEQAEAALERAREAEADRYALDEWHEARTALDRAKLEIEAQAKTMALRRSYDEARRLLVDAKSAAESARDAAVSGREQAREEARHALERADEALLEAQSALESTQDNESEIAAMKIELGEARVSLEAANADFAAGDYIAARNLADGARDRAKSIVEGLTRSPT